GKGGQCSHHGFLPEVAKLKGMFYEQQARLTFMTASLGTSILSTLYYALALLFGRRRLIEPPLRPAACASSLVHLCAVPCAWAALPPLLAISRFFSELIDAKPRPLPLLDGIVNPPFIKCLTSFNGIFPRHERYYPSHISIEIFSSLKQSITAN